MRTEHNSISKSLLYLYFHLQKMYLHQNSKGALVEELVSLGMNVQVKLHVEVIFCILEMILVIFLFNLPVFLNKTKPKSEQSINFIVKTLHAFFLTGIEELVSVELKGVQTKKTHATIILIKWETDQLTEGHIVCITKTGTESF